MVMPHFITESFALGDFVHVYGEKAMTITNLSDTSSVPEPSALVLFGTGILDLAGAARKNFSAKLRNIPQGAKALFYTGY